MRNTPERHQQLGEFFTTNHDRLQRAVTRSISARPELIDDACADAWTILLRRPDVTLDQRGFRWLLTVAINEALRLLRRTRGETPVGAFQADSRGHDDEDVPEPIDPETSAADDRALELIDHAERVQLFQELKPREREALYLKALGYSYHEIERLSRGVRVNVAVLLGADVGDMSLMEASRLRFVRSEASAGAPAVAALVDATAATDVESRRHAGTGRVHRQRHGSFVGAITQGRTLYAARPASVPSEGSRRGRWGQGSEAQAAVHRGPACSSAPPPSNRSRHRRGTARVARPRPPNT